MNAIDLELLLNNIKALPKLETDEPTLFSIGGRGYYENPTTDVLAFFCDTEGAHGLGNLVIEALFDALEKSNKNFDSSQISNYSVINKPQREVTTRDNKRIDLLLEGDDWIIIMENKIFHHQSNPFETYRKHSFINRYKDKQPFLVVLSPKGGAPIDWLSLNYARLIDSLKQRIAIEFVNRPINKWMILLREFILHLERLMPVPKMNQQTTKFIMNNLRELKEAQETKEKVIAVFQNELLQKIQEKFVNEQVVTKLHHFHGYPALRYSFKSWETKSDIVLFLDGRKDKEFCINYYAFNIKYQEQRAVADKYLKESENTYAWNERSDTIRCYKLPFKDFNENTAFERMTHMLTLMHKFETEVRSTW